MASPKFLFQSFLGEIMKQGLTIALVLSLLSLGSVFAHGDEASNPTLWVANGAENSLSIIDRVTGEELSRLDTGFNPHILDISPDGKYIYVVNAGAHDASHHPEAQDKAASNSLWVHDAKTGEVIAEISVGQGPTHPLASQDGQRIYVTNTDESSVSVIDTETWQVIKTIEGLAEPHDADLSPDGSLLFLASSANSSLSVVNTNTFTLEQSIPVGTKPRGVVADNMNGDLVYLTNKGDGSLSIIDVSIASVKTFEIGIGAHALRLSPDNKTIYVALSGENSVAVINAKTGEVNKRINVGAAPEQLDLSGDGAFLAVSNNKDNSITLVNLMNGQVTTIAVGKGAYGAQFSNLPFHNN